MARTALLALLPAALIATGWRQLEFPAEGGALGLAALLGVGVALLPRRWLQWAGAAGATLVVLHFAFGLSSVRGVLGDVWNGVLDFYEIALPFDPGQRERMHGIVLVAVFVFTLGASLAIARRRALLASALTFAGAAWPVTLIRDAPSTARGILLLLASLLLLAALRVPESRRAGGQTALVGAAVVLAAVVAVSSPAVAKGGFLDWEQWEPYTRETKPVSVSYVWDADYNGITFPKDPTTVLTIKAPRRVSYWRATTLDDFEDDHWQEVPRPTFPTQIDERDALFDDPFLPARAANPEGWMEQEVRVRALSDDHLVGATVPVAFERDAAFLYSPGVAHVGRLERNQEYKVWSWVQQPSPRQLAAAPTNYDIATGTVFLATPSGFVPPFGTPGRDARVRELFAGNLGGNHRYDRLYDLALEVAGQPRNPYAAVIALEAWFRSGRFVYDETPPVSRRVPPLLDFVIRHRRGYCQHFAGAMALMLRYLGIPARVGAGFTTGRYDDEREEWTVSDKNAHTWVEAWFTGYGWLPFDPTPGRSGLASTYTTSSVYFDVSGAQGLLAGLGEAGREALAGRGSADDNANSPRGLDPAGRAAGGEGSSSDGGALGSSLVALALTIAAGLTAGLWALKLLRRRLRYLTRDPRRVAGAIRLDLVEFLVDQRLAIASSATPAEVGRELERAVDIRGDRLAEELAKARYGPEAGAAEAAMRARRELRVVRGRIRRRLGLGERLRGLLSLRSLGLGSQ